MMKGVVLAQKNSSGTSRSSAPSQFASRVGLTDEEIEEVCRLATADFFDPDTKLTNAWIFVWARKVHN